MGTKHSRASYPTTVSVIADSAPLISTRPYSPSGSIGTLWDSGSSRTRACGRPGMANAVAEGARGRYAVAVEGDTEDTSWFLSAARRLAELELGLGSDPREGSDPPSALDRNTPR